MCEQGCVCLCHGAENLRHWCSSSSLPKASCLSPCLPGKPVPKPSRILPFLQKHLTTEALRVQRFTVCDFTRDGALRILPLTFVSRVLCPLSHLQSPVYVENNQTQVYPQIDRSLLKTILTGHSVPCLPRGHGDPRSILRID